MLKCRTHLVAEEAARNVDLLAPDDDNLLAIQNLLRDYRGQPSEQMALAINDDGGRGEGGHGSLWVALNTSTRGVENGENERTYYANGQ